MLRYENGGNTIFVKLPHTDYTVMMMANWVDADKEYSCKTYISRNDTENFSVVEENIKISSDIKTIKIKMASYITDRFNKGNYNRFIEIYEYENKCFEIGNDIMESNAKVG